MLNGLLCDVKCTWCDYRTAKWQLSQCVIR